VEAFKATLEEVCSADLLLHVVDSSYEENQFHIDVTRKVLEEIGAGGKDSIMVYNKMDLLEDENISEAGNDSIFVSAKEGTNIEEL
ncbi:GTPase HflX, partial [Acinetobacter sp. 163]|nr:GTPase HflX [Acinetobacter sp. 163]